MLRIKDESEVWWEDENKVEECFVKYFQGLFKTDGRRGGVI